MARQRIFHSDNGTFIDLTSKLNNYETGSHTLALVASEDYVYIASEAPFNFLYWKVGTANVATSSIDTIEVCNGSNWKAAVEIGDETSVGGIPFAQSGNISFVPNRKESWNRISDTETVTELTSITVYDMYWCRIKFTADVSVTLDWLGYLFNTDIQLGHEYPDLIKSKVLSSFGVTDWEAQVKTAAELIIKDLKRNNTIYSPFQILQREDLELASVQRVAELIYGGRGPSYEDDRLKAMNKYKERLDSSILVVDQDDDGIIDAKERTATPGELIR